MKPQLVHTGIQNTPAEHIDILFADVPIRLLVPVRCGEAEVDDGYIKYVKEVISGSA